ncbi:hypothetical protein BWI96_15635 [Siphonobacter sp. SORGH_AS_0500]|nr:hypothetical protein BWI96_15635 [Siphonobacter sp. SORGH_AS_0500]
MRFYFLGKPSTTRCVTSIKLLSIKDVLWEFGVLVSMFGVWYPKKNSWQKGQLFFKVCYQL